MKRVTIGCGHITNSSSVVHYFDRSLLEDPEVARFIETYDLKDGCVGNDLWHRGACSSFLVTKEQKAAANSQLTGDENPFDFDTSGPYISEEKDQEVVIIYGDEYTSFASVLNELLRQAAEKKGSGYFGGDDYN